MKQKKIIIFGNTNFAKMVKYYIETDTDENFVGFTVDQKFIDKDDVNQTNIVPFEEIESIYPQDEYKILPVIGYNKMNEIRRKIHQSIKLKGYEIASFVHPSANIAKNVELGEGNIFLENTLIQPFVSIGNGNIFWSNINISHHSIIGNFNFFAPSSSTAGNVIIQDNCFLGNNCTVKNGVEIKSYTLIGAGAYVSTNTKEDSVIVPARSSTLNNVRSMDIDLL
ncbi:acetyltransferase [Margalitia sp. FSL K6-0131]|uniref:acetyltransferase n=1 Tax=Margalitia sp. FSL K6-0131 TaxID=2954604 RepID=UPI0030F85F0C